VVVNFSGMLLGKDSLKREILILLEASIGNSLKIFVLLEAHTGKFRLTGSFHWK